ncbi:MAG: CDP-alcohol phosphatidyltransferase family protein [Paludibacteraceae bacterium]|nr:CDP-alcohol phosphatidyltransferase family protein [Paludibacteraceae bacterium]
MKEIKKLQKRPDGIFGSFMTRPVSHVVAYMSYKIGLSPNVVSFISFVLCSAAVSVLLIQNNNNYIIAALVWWLAAIFDAADGDLARYANLASPFGGWFDSLLDRMKEFMIFSVLGYLAFKQFQNEIYLLMGVLSVFSNVMSGWISDTKKLFINNRQVEISLSKKYSLGMVDTRDFFVIASLLLGEIRLSLYAYSTFFILVLMYQIVKFYVKYGNPFDKK